MVSPISDIGSPSGSLPSSPEKSSEFIARLKNYVIKDINEPNSSDLKIITCFLRHISSPSSDDCDNLNKIITWISENKLVLLKIEHLNLKNLADFSDTLSKIAKFRDAVKISDIFVNNIYEIILKYVEIKSNDPSSESYKLFLINDFQLLSSKIQKKDRRVVFLLSKISNFSL